MPWCRSLCLLSSAVASLRVSLDLDYSSHANSSSACRWYVPLPPIQPFLIVPTVNSCLSYSNKLGFSAPNSTATRSFRSNTSRLDDETATTLPIVTTRGFESVPSTSQAHTHDQARTRFLLKIPMAPQTQPQPAPVPKKYPSSPSNTPGQDI